MRWTERQIVTILTPSGRIDCLRTKPQAMIHLAELAEQEAAAGLSLANTALGRIECRTVRVAVIGRVVVRPVLVLSWSCAT